MDNMCNWKTPKGEGEMGLKHQRPCNVMNVLVLSLNQSILLRSLNTRFFMQNSFWIIKWRHGKLNTIIASYNFDCFVKLYMNERHKINKVLPSFKLWFHEFRPSEFWVFIYNSQEIFMALYGRNRVGAPNINMH